MDVDPPFPVAGNGECQQRHREGGGDRPPQSQPRIDPATGDKCIREQKELVGKQQAERQAHRPDVPTPLGIGVAPQILDRQQPENAKPDAAKHL